MENTLNPNDHKEFMRMAMLKHEETFREQVNELHRLYRIQKMLMESVGQRQKQKLERSNNNLVENSKTPFILDHYQQQLLLQQAQRDIITTNINNASNISNNNIIITPDNTLATSNNGQEDIAESNSNLMMLDENEIELSLSLGPSTLNPRSRKPGKSIGSGDQSLSSSSTGSSETRKRSSKSNSNSTRTWASFSHHTGSGIEAGFSNGQQNGNPSWLYQALSLKLT